MRGLPTLLRLATSRAATRAMATGGSAVDTLIFDVDDTLYPVSSGFSKHRNGPIVARFMVDELGFESEAEALALRDEVFRATHSTLKGLTLGLAGGAPAETLRGAHARRILGGALRVRRLSGGRPTRNNEASTGRRTASSSPVN